MQRWLPFEVFFPHTKIFICDFHREQAWERWVKEKKHGLSDVQGSVLLELLRDCANAPPHRDKASDYHYKQAEKLLQDLDVWKGNEQVQQWLSNTWLPCSKVGKVRSLYNSAACVALTVVHNAYDLAFELVYH